MPQINSNAFLPKYFKQYGEPHFLFRPSNLPIEWVQRFYPMLNYTKKWFINRLDPFRLCPITIFFWFIIPPYGAIGIRLRDLNEVAIFWRQQIEPNETLYLLFQITQFKLPFPLTLLVMFSSLGLVITDGANRLLQEIQTAIDEKNQDAQAKALDPFRLTPRLSIYYPILDDHVELGFLTIDFRHVEISLKQVMEPNGTVVSLIRFLDLYTPYPLQIMVMSLSFGLFIANSIYKYGKTLVNPD